MKPIKFKQATVELQKPENMTDEECSPLWVFIDNNTTCISCWRLSWKERFKLLFHGNIWLSILSGKTQPPVWLSADKTVFINEK